VNVVTAALDWDDTNGDCLSGDPDLVPSCPCGDHHGLSQVLTTAWQDYEFEWDQLEQVGWGAQADFDASRIIAVAIGPLNPVFGQPFDSELWVDDLEFLPLPPNNGTEGCEGGAGGIGGSGG
jgi:hypothetical protein